MEKRRILIKGPKLHNIGYRAFLLEEAESLLITNYSAKNIENETEMIEILVGGSEEKIGAFVDFVKNNYPEEAEVADISVEAYKGNIMSIEAFSRSFSATQLSKVARTGVAVLKNQKEHIDITKEGFKELKEESEKTRETVRDESQKTRDELGGIIKDESEKTRDELGGIIKDESKATRGDITDSLEGGFGGLRQEHVKTRELSKEIFYSEVQELRRDLNSLRSTVEDIRKKVEAI